MSQENVELIRRGLEATSRQDWDAVVADLDPEIEINDPTLLDAGEYRGHEGFFKWLAVWGASWESWRMEDIEILPAGDDQVVALFRMAVQGKGSGVEIEGRNAIVYKLRMGKCVRMGYYTDEQQALEAAGLGE